MWKPKYLNTGYIVLTGILTGLLIGLSLVTVVIKFGNSSFQIADGIFLALTLVVPGPMMLIVGFIYPIVFDLISGGLVFIPASLVIHLLMFLVLKVCQKWISKYLLLLITSILIFTYVPYNYLLNLDWGVATAQAVAIRELIIDCIQAAITYVSAVTLTLIFNRIKLKAYLNQQFYFC